MPTLTAPTFLSDTEAADIRADFNQALGESNLLKETVTYESADALSGSAAYDPTTGTVTSPYTEVSLSAIVGAIDEEKIRRDNATGRLATHKVLLDGKDFTGGQLPQTGDKIRRASGMVLEVLEVRHNTVVGVVVCYCAVFGGE